MSALIDASDCLDAGAAEVAGVDLSRLLWVRCGKKRKAGPAECGKAGPAECGKASPAECVASPAECRKAGPVERGKASPVEHGKAGPVEHGKRPEFRDTAGRQPEPRHAERRWLNPLEQAFKAADILIQNGGLGLIVIDLGDIEERLVRKIPLTTWFRFARVVEKQPTALVVFATYPAAQSCAALTLHIKNPEAHWNTEAKSEARAHSNQQEHSGLHFAGSQDSDGVQQQVIGAQQQTIDDQKQVIEKACQADHKGITHTQFFSGLTYEVELGRARGQGRKLVESSVASVMAKLVWK